MKITAITRYKHGELYAILQRIGWTQSELARQTDLRIGTIGDIINLVKRPTVEQADAIQKAVGTAGEYLDVLSEWPETFAGLKRGYKLEQTAEVEMENLLGCREAMMLPAPEPTLEDAVHLEDAMESAMSDLTTQQKFVLKHRFWKDETLEEVGSKLGRTRGRVRQIEAKALRMLRHPKRLQKLEACGLASANG